MELPINGAPNDALNNTTYPQEGEEDLNNTTYPQEGEEDLKNNSGGDEEEKSHYEWDEPEYKVNFVHFINEEPIIDTTIRLAAGTVDKTVELVYDHHARIKERSRLSGDNRLDHQSISGSTPRPTPRSSPIDFRFSLRPNLQSTLQSSP